MNMWYNGGNNFKAPVVAGAVSKGKAKFPMNTSIIPQSDSYSHSQFPEFRKVLPDIINVDGQPHYPVLALVEYFYEGKSNADAAWQNIRRRLKRDNSELLLQIQKFPRMAADGKMRPTYYANLALCFRIVEEIDAPKAGPVKEFLAQCASEKVREIGWDASMVHRRLLEGGTLDDLVKPDQWVDIVGGDV